MLFFIREIMDFDDVLKQAGSYAPVCGPSPGIPV
jgi:hypothetical protein